MSTTFGVLILTIPEPPDLLVGHSSNQDMSELELPLDVPESVRRHHDGLMPTFIPIIHTICSPSQHPKPSRVWS